MCESVMTHLRGVETDYDSGASRVMTTEAVTALASAAVYNYARRWNTIGCEE